MPKGDTEDESASARHQSRAGMGEFRGGWRFTWQAALMLGLWLLGAYAVSFVPLPKAVWGSFMGMVYLGIGVWIWLYVVDYMRTAQRREASGAGKPPNTSITLIVGAWSGGYSPLGSWSWEPERSSRASSVPSDIDYDTQSERCPR